VVICLERGADLHIAQLMPLPLTVACFSKIQTGFTFLVPAHPGNPGQTAVKRVCVSQKSDGTFYYIHTLLFKLCYLLNLQLHTIDLVRIGVSGESSFWYRPTRVVPDQRPLNGRCCCYVTFSSSVTVDASTSHCP